MKESKNWWPHFIILLVLFAIALGVWTVKVAIDNPVELDNSYMMKYQELDSKIYQLERMKKEFYENYELKLLTKKLDFPHASFILELTDKEGNPVPDAKITLLFTRPFTTKEDVNLTASYQDGKYIGEVTLPARGRWDVIVKIQKDNLELFEKYRLSTQRELERIKL